MRFVLLLAMMIAVALSIGFGLSHAALTNGRYVGAVTLGGWTAWPDMGTASPNPYSRAHITRDAALQLGRAEGLQFTASADSTGQPLDLACSYRLTGRVPVSSFWSLVAVSPDWVNLAAPDTPASLRSSDVVRANDGTLDIAIGTRLSSGTWLELAGTGPFTLAMTLYDTTAFSGFGSGNDTMPVITRGDCA